MLPKGRYFFHTRPSIAKYFHIIYMVFLISSIPPHIMSVRRLRTWGWVCEVSSLVFQKGICAFFSFCRFYRMLLLIYVICVKTMWFFSYLVFACSLPCGEDLMAGGVKRSRNGELFLLPRETRPLLQLPLLLLPRCVYSAWHPFGTRLVVCNTLVNTTPYIKNRQTLCVQTRVIFTFFFIFPDKSFYVVTYIIVNK